MTLPTSGQPISISDINVELGNSAVLSANLSFLNGFIKPAQQPSSPNLNAFHDKAYYQRNADGNCDNGNTTNCNCNCGNIQCNATNNCTAVNCANCDTQKYLQSNCNCAVTYNCTSNANCFSYNCNCSKIICTKLYELALMERKIFEADQAFGLKVQKHNPQVYAGYVAWAETVVDWMSGTGPLIIPFMSEEKQTDVLREWAISWSHDIATPWAEYMAYRMGVLEYENKTGKVLHLVGSAISWAIGGCSKVFKTKKPVGAFRGAALVTVFVLIKGIVEVGKLFDKSVKHVYKDA